jgi:hypothetical protein
VAAKADVYALLDELDRRIAGAHRRWFGTRIRLNRKQTLRLVEEIGERLDLRQGAPASPIGGHVTHVQTIQSQVFASLDSIVRNGGQGGALYRLRYLDVKPQQLTDVLRLLRASVDLRSKEQWEQR